MKQSQKMLAWQEREIWWRNTIRALSRNIKTKLRSLKCIWASDVEILAFEWHYFTESQQTNSLKCFSSNECYHSVMFPSCRWQLKSDKMLEGNLSWAEFIHWLVFESFICINTVTYFFLISYIIHVIMLLSYTHVYALSYILHECAFQCQFLKS